MNGRNKQTLWRHYGGAMDYADNMESLMIRLEAL